MVFIHICEGVISSISYEQPAAMLMLLAVFKWGTFLGEF